VYTGRCIKLKVYTPVNGPDPLAVPHIWSCPNKVYVKPASVVYTIPKFNLVFAELLDWYLTLNCTFILEIIF
jgi:hypothetical protein